MNRLPSPYNAATGGITGPEPAPLSPLYRISYSLDGAHGMAWMRAASIEELIGEIKRLYSPRAKYMVWCEDTLVRDTLYSDPGDNGAPSCHGHPGAPEA